jgi:hypothetical protein
MVTNTILADLRLVITYASDTRVLKESMKRKLLITERHILRRIFRPTKDTADICRIKTNGELNNLIRNKKIITYIKAQRLSLFGHVHLMTTERMVKKLYEWKLI